MAKIVTSDLAAEFADEMGVMKPAAKQYIDTLAALICRHVEQGDDVVIANFGTFRMRMTTPRHFVSPLDGQSHDSVSRPRIAFEMSRKLAEAYGKKNKEGDTE